MVLAFQVKSETSICHFLHLLWWLSCSMFIILRILFAEHVFLNISWVSKKSKIWVFHSLYISSEVKWRQSLPIFSLYIGSCPSDVIDSNERKPFQFYLMETTCDFMSWAPELMFIMAVNWCSFGCLNWCVYLIHFNLPSPLYVETNYIYIFILYWFHSVNADYPGVHVINLILL